MVLETTRNLVQQTLWPVQPPVAHARAWCTAPRRPRRQVAAAALILVARPRPSALAARAPPLARRRSNGPPPLPFPGGNVLPALRRVSR